MVEFIQQIFSLLINPPGNLTYYLVVAFSIIAALPGAYQVAQSAHGQARRRMIFGLSLLLASRLILFLGAALAWQGLYNDQNLLPTLDRLVTLLSLVLIIWLWTAPDKMRLVDAATTLLAILMLTAAIFSLLWWSNQPAEMVYNGSWPDQIGEAIGALLSLGGIVLLLMRRPPGWGMGIAMLTVLAAGHLAHLGFAIPNDGDYPGAVRLAQMIAYPFLLVLPQRFSALAPATEPAISQPASTSGEGNLARQPDPSLMLLELAALTDTDQVCQGLSRLLAQTLQADICLISGVPDRSAGINILCGYDQIRAGHLEGSYLDAQAAAALLPALQSGEPVQMTQDNSPSELNTLTHALNLKKSSDALIFPLQDEHDQPIAGLILLSLYNPRDWNRADLAQLDQIAKLVGSLLKRSHASHNLKHELSQAQAQLAELQTELQQERQANRNLRTQINELQTAAAISQPRDSQAASFAALLAAQEDAQELIKQLRTENERLEQELRSLGGLAETPPIRTERASELDTAYREGELRLALEEIARLNTLLSEADKGLLAVQKQSQATVVPNQAHAALTSLALELRQPMSAIAGYTDFLLGESVGILGTLQRKFLERVKTATQRMSRLVDDLILVARGDELSHSPNGSTRIDLNSALDQAIEAVSDQLQAKNISLEVEINSDLPELESAGSTLQEVLSDLLEHAVEITPVQGVVTLRAGVHDEQSNPRYMLFQVSDQGGGIPAEEIPHLFSDLDPSAEPQTPGDGSNAARLQALRARIEALAGRIWVDSQPGTGSTVSVLVPVYDASFEISTRQADQE